MENDQTKQMARDAFAPWLALTGTQKFQAVMGWVAIIGAGAIGYKFGQRSKKLR